MNSKFGISSRALFLVATLGVVLFSTEALGQRCHEVETDVGTEPGLSADICSINDALGRSPPDFVTARAYYTFGFDSKEPSLQEVANGTFYGAYFNLSSALLGGDDWIDVQLVRAFNGVGALNTTVARVQFIKKILQATLLGARMFSNMEQAYNALEEEDAESALNYWDLALANHYGSASRCSIYANGHARGIEFRTMEDGVSSTNERIARAFAAGGRIINAKRPRLARFRTQMDKIRDNYIIIYLQSVMKYATRIFEEVELKKSQAEGFAYFHAVAPFVNQTNSDAFSVILDCFDVAEAPDSAKAEAVLELMEGLLDDLSLSDIVFGEFDEDNDDNYEPPPEFDCAATNPFENNVLESFDNDG